MKYLMNINYTIRHFFAQQFTLWRLLLLLLCAPSLSYATHIVGGEVGYRCLGNDRYEITVRVYRDCAPSTEPFDRVASVGIFDRNGLLLQDVRINATSATPLDNNLDACIQATTKVCVETMTYKATVSLPFRVGGYQIVYQRCCRNRTILNIVNPLETGATYDIWLTEAAMRRCNNSATFRRWPDIYICNNRPLDFDHSAIDVDGDSLVYRLCTPMQGATFAKPQPQPPNFPPFDTLLWLKPLYNLQNMLGLGEPLRINSQSGLLTARPGLLGQFVIGICVDEYDRTTKSLISSTRRDFQYNVQNCESVVAAFFAPESQCDSLKVQFRNESIGANNYLWLFDAPRTNLSSTEANPLYTFPAFNEYKVSLIAEPGTACADTFSRQVRLRTSGIKADFKTEILPCAAESILRLQDLSTDSTAAIVKRLWKITFGDGGVINATGADTLVRLPLDISGTIMLTVINANGCEKTISRSFSTAGIQGPCEGIPDTVRACIGSIVPLNPTGVATSAYTYRWEPAGLMDDANAVNPRYTVTQSGVINLTITANSAQSCTCSKTITVIALPRPEADFTVDAGVGNNPIVVSSCDGRSFSVKNTSTNAGSVKWIIGDINNPIQVSTDNNPVFNLPDTGTYTLTLIAFGECNDTIQKTIRLSKLDTNVDFTFNYTSCIFNGSTIKLLDVSNNPGVQIVSRTWKLSDGRTSMEESPSFSFTDSGRVTVTLIIRTAQGCVDSASQSIVKAPISGVAIPDTVIICRGVPFQLPGNNNPNLTYTWLPETGLDDPTVGNPIFSPQQSTAYTVDIAVPGIPSCTVRDSMMAVVPNNMAVVVTGPGADGTPVCTPQTTLTASANRPVTFRWLDANGNQLATGTQFTATVATQRNLIIEATDEDGCIEKLEVNLVGSPIVFSAPDSLIACTGESLQINTTQGPGQILTFTWTPSNAFASGTNTANPVLADLPGLKEVFVTVRNSAGCSLQDSVQVAIVDVNHNLDFTPKVQCDGNTVVFQNTSTNAFGYLWNFGDGTFSTEENPEHKYAQSGKYSVTLTLQLAVSCRKVVTKEIEITTGSAIGLKVPNNLTTCGEDVTLTASGNEGTTFRWTNRQGQLLSSNASVTVNPPPGTTVYYVTAENELGCTETDSVSVTDNGIDVTLITPTGGNRIDQCDAESVQIQVRNNAENQQLTYNWTPVFNVVSGGNTANPVLRPTEIGANTITGIISNQFECEDTLTIIINLGALDSGLPDTVQVCAGVATPLAPNANAEYSYQWSPATGLSATNVRNPTFTGTAPATYRVTVTKTSGGISCQVVDTVVVQISPKPTLSVSTMDTIACVGTTLRIFAFGAAEYIWYIAGSQGDKPPFNAEGGLAISATSGIDATYEVIGRNAFGCTDTITGVRIRFVDFNPGTIASPLSLCKNGSIPLNPNGNRVYQYQWSPTTGLNLSNPANPIATISQTTEFRVTITDPASGCFKERSVRVNVNVIDGFKASNDTTICSPSNLTLRASANGSNVNFRWLDANGQQIGTGANLTVTPAIGVNLYVAEASDGTCTERDTVKVNVADFKPGDLTSPQSACAGEPLALNPNGNPAYQYQWSPTTGLNLTNPSNPIATLTTSTTFKVTVTDPISGCRLEKEIQVNVIDLSDLAIVPTDTTVCQPGAVNLRITGASGASIRWLDANGTQIGTGRSISPSPNIGLNLYIAEATAGSCSKRDTSRVTRADFKPGDLASPQAVCAGQPLPLNPNGNPAYQYQWSPTTGLNLSNPSNPIATITTSTTYLVTVTDPVSGCSLETEIQVNVTDLGDLEAIPSDTSLCQPDFIFLTVRGAQGASVRWLNADGQVLGTGRNLSVTPALGLNLYIVEATLGTCSKRDTARVTLNDFRPGDLTSPQAACGGQPLALNPNGNPAYQYQWSPTAGLNLSNPHNPIATINTSTTYTVTVTDPVSGCRLEKEIRVNVTDVSNLAIVPSDTTVCQAGGVPLRVTGAEGANVRWLDANGTQIGTGRNISPSPNVGLNLYIAEATVGTCSKRDTSRVTRADFQPGDLASPQTVCAGQPLALNPDGNPAYQYQWSPTAGLNLSNPHNPIATLTTSTTYRVTVTDPVSGCRLEKEIQVNVTDLGDLEAIPSDTALCQPGFIFLTVRGAQGATIRWLDANGQVLSTGRSLSVTPVLGLNLYIVEATLGTCSKRDTARVRLSDFKPGDLKSPQEVCVGTSIELNPNGNPAYTYNWSPTTGLDLSKPYNPVATVSATTTYTVTVTDPATGCNVTKTIVVQVSQPITVIALPDTSLCEPGRLTLRASTSRPTSITWFSDAGLKNQIGTGPRISVNVGPGKNVFYAVATDTNDVCIRARIDSVRNSGGTGGTGGSGGGGTIGAGGPFAGAPLDSAVINVVDLPAGAPPSMITSCGDRPTPINPNGNPVLVYRWSPAAGLNDSTSATPTATVAVPTTYTVTISDQFGVCSIVRQVVVSPAAPINADAGRDTVLCNQNPYNLMARGNGGAVFEWSNNRNIAPVIGQGDQFVIVPDTISRTFYVRITNGAGCSEIDSVRVIARPLKVSLPATVNACETNDEVSLLVNNADRTQTLSYLWSPANLFISNVQTGPSAIARAQDGANLQVRVTNQFGCSTTLSTRVIVLNLENTVRVTADKTTIMIGESATIRVENCPSCSYSWTPATGLNNTTGSTVIASPTETTEYTLRVTSNGCTAEFKITITVEGPYCVEPYIFVPTAFTPNKDGVNDVLYVRGRGIENMTFVIYNRWNQRMFETTDPNVGWDGTFRGKALPPDVYGFYLVANCIDGTVYRKQGNVTLIR